jgi:hypothetical protein
MSEKLTTILNEQVEHHAARDAYVNANRGEIDAAQLATLNSRLEAADKAAFLAKREQSERLAAMKPDEYAAFRARFIRECDFNDSQRRERFVRGL